MDSPNVIRLLALHELLAPKRLTEIVDIGANPVITPDYEDMYASGIVKVTGFEPHPEAFEALEGKQSANARYFPYAVGDGGPHELKVCKSSGFTSLLEPNTKTLDYLGRFHRQCRVKERLPVETKRLDDLDGLGTFDLLKIDIQGAELDVFRNARTAMSGCLAVMTEVAFVPLYRDQPLIDAQMSELRMQGFHLHKFMFAKTLPMPSTLDVKLRRRVRSNQLIDGDAVFIRDLFDLATAQDETLKHLAVLADGCFGSFDLAVRCLSHLVDRGAFTADECRPYLKLLEQI